MNSHQRRVQRRARERSYDAYLASCAAECRCCECAGICAGVAAGGLCDRQCFCGRDDDCVYDLDRDDDDPRDADEPDDDEAEPYTRKCCGCDVKCRVELLERVSAAFVRELCPGCVADALADADLCDCEGDCTRECCVIARQLEERGLRQREAQVRGGIRLELVMGGLDCD